MRVAGTDSTSSAFTNLTFTDFDAGLDGAAAALALGAVLAFVLGVLLRVIDNLYWFEGRAFFGPCNIASTIILHCTILTILRIYCQVRNRVLDFWIH